MVWAGCSRAGPKRSANDLGDDAFFVCDSENAAGVADGVGSWRKKGIQSGVFSRSLMTNTRNLIESGFNAFDAVSVALNDWSGVEYGSTTLILAQQVENRLYVVQLGDSQMIVIRQGRIIFSSNPQEHMFNVPYQVGSDSDSINDALRYSVEVEPGDTIIMGSDGLFNNVYERHITDIVNQFPISNDSSVLQEIADFLQDYAWNLSQNTEYWSPYAQRKYEYGLIDRESPESRGGKPDDVAVVVGRIQ